MKEFYLWYPNTRYFGKELQALHLLHYELLKAVHSEACISRNVCALREQRSVALLLGKERSVMNCGI
jgi:hypothetical protein